MNLKNILYIYAVALLSIASATNAKADILPERVLIGYWHNWENAAAPFLAPEKVHQAYNVINIAFATPRNNTDFDIYFHPLIIKKDDFKSRIKSIQSQGKKVLLSIGGGNTSVTLDSSYEKDVFVQSVLRLLVDYEFDGMDLDFEGTSIRLTGGTIETPVDSSIILMTAAVKEIMADYHSHFKRKAILTLAPETAYVQGGQSGFGGIWGAYLPLMDALRDSIDLISVQLYNSGAMYGLDWNIYYQSTPDFIIAMTEKLIKGFNTKGGFFKGFPESKIIVGLPACNRAAGSGFAPIDSINLAMNYLLGKSSSQPGVYKLKQEGGYPKLRGMMTWSINWDASDSCSYSYEFADNFQKLFPKPASVAQSKPNKKVKTIDDIYFDLFPNPARTFIEIKLPEFASNFLPLSYEVRNINGQSIRSGKADKTGFRIDIQSLPKGVYFISISDCTDKFIKE